MTVAKKVTSLLLTHDATDRVLHGDFSHRVPIVSNDEIAVLAKTNIPHFIQKPLTGDLRALVLDVISGATARQSAET